MCVVCHVQAENVANCLPSPEVGLAVCISNFMQQERCCVTYHITSRLQQKVRVIHTSLAQNAYLAIMQVWPEMCPWPSRKSGPKYVLSHHASLARNESRVIMQVWSETHL